METINKKCEENKILKQETVLGEKKITASRKISLTCQTLNTQKFRAPIQIAKTSCGRLRSPVISPLGSPSTSRKPNVTTKSRFQITPVSENQNATHSATKSRFIVSSVQDNFKSQETTQQMITNNNNAKEETVSSISNSDDDFINFDSNSEKIELFQKGKVDNIEEEGLQEIQVNIDKCNSSPQLEIKNINNSNEHHESNTTKNGIKILDKILNKENDEDIVDFKLDDSDDNYISEDKNIHMDDLNIHMVDQTDLQKNLMDTSEQS